MIVGGGGTGLGRVFTYFFLEVRASVSDRESERQ
jgi:hypothetical protein